MTSEVETSPPVIQEEEEEEDEEEMVSSDDQPLALAEEAVANGSPDLSVCSDSDPAGPYEASAGPQKARHKRKNFQPRNIVLYQYSESEDGYSEDDDEALQPLDLSSGDGCKPPELPKNDKRPVDLRRRSESPPAAVDLSRKSGGHHHHHHHHPRRHLPALNNRDGFVPSGDASAMKVYAENTMKELLSIYGLNDMVESITKHVPLHNFSSGKILESMNPYQQMASFLPYASLPGVALEGSEEERKPTLVSTTNNNNSGPHPEEAHRESNAGSDAPSLDNPWATERGLPSHNHPRMMLSSTMADTFLTLAALGSKVSTTSSPLSTPTTPTTPTLMMGHGISSTTPTSSTDNSMCLVMSSPKTSQQQQDHVKTVPVDYSRYVKRYGSAGECGSSYCKDLNYREHFHCIDCNSRVFVKKEEMIRHFKWHKKRDESLQHGFMRYSPMDDCSEKFLNCSHNRKQTHYHCLKESCDKVYISTSDVQMHANTHRKDSAIIQEGFQRFKATEGCHTSSCAFFGQRTTHFHCRRVGCSYTFKNKADMEKHKTYHIKDEQLNKDGFKKFMKHEHCSYPSCRFSRVCNHIHCIRPGCIYVLHSSGQLYSHKRKHERKDSELAYRKYKLAQSMIKTIAETGGMNSFFPDQGSSNEVGTTSSMNLVKNVEDDGVASSQDSVKKNDTPAQPPYLNFNDLLAGVKTNMPFNMAASPHDYLVQNNLESFKFEAEDFWKKFLARYGMHEVCKSHCEYIYKDHFHCMTGNCDLVFRAKDIAGVQEHARNHEHQEQISENFFLTVDAGQNFKCPHECLVKEKHYHCSWEGCHEMISSMDKPFRRLDHYKIHEYSCKLSMSREANHHVPFISGVDGLYKRKRGRPPKNRVIEFPVQSASSQPPQAIYTSFKLQKTPQNIPPTTYFQFSPSTPLMTGPMLLPKGTVLTSPTSAMALLAPPPLVLAQGEISSTDHSSEGHCNESRVESATAHLNNTHIKQEVQEGFYVFPDNAPCPDQLCQFSRRHHFHCTQPRCFYVTDRSDILLLHSKDFHDNIDILEGFVFFDRSVDCRMPGCHSNKVNRHFHCTRPGCSYSFVRYSTMTQHEQKHAGVTSSSPTPPPKKKSRPSSTSEDERTTSPNSTTPHPAGSNETMPKSGTVIKAAGTFYPLSAFSSSPPAISTSGQQQQQEAMFTPSADEASSDVLKLPSCSSPSSSTTTTDGEQQPLSKLLQQPGPSPKNTLQGSEKHVQYGQTQSCGRPFCKLKRKEHFHCNICNQAFSNFSRLKPHVVKHSGAVSPVPIYTSSGAPCGSPNGSSRLSPSYDQDGEERGSEEEEMPEQEDEDGEEDDEPEENSLPEAPPPALQPITAAEDNSHSTYHHHHHRSVSTAAPIFTWVPMIPTCSSIMTKAESSFPTTTVVTPTNLCATPSPSGEGFYQCLDYSSRCEPNSSPVYPPAATTEEVKRMKLQSFRILKDEPVPRGYIRYRFNEDCNYVHCGYREHQTHFHCTRKDCGYSFCDKTRFVQHTARHERLDTLMGGDFQQFRANVNCGRTDCIYANTLGAMANKASHFHCYKCDFVCTDTNKVVAHRRHHAKMDSINAAGFEKYTPSQNCGVEGCNHNQRQTHYHCLKCQYAVLGLSQMSSHKYRHAD